MSQQSEELILEQIVQPTEKARVIPFERPQSELQKAVQQRAQETIDRERERASRQRPAPLRRVFVLALAAIPVFLTFGAAVGFVGALRQFNSAILDSEPTSTQTQAAPASPPIATTPTDSDVVILQPLNSSQGPARTPAPNPTPN